MDSISRAANSTAAINEEIEEIQLSPISCLPAEILTHIFSYLKPKELAPLSLVNHEWRQIADDQQLWPLKDLLFTRGKKGKAAYYSQTLTLRFFDRLDANMNRIQTPFNFVNFAVCKDKAAIMNADHFSILDLKTGTFSAPTAIPPRFRGGLFDEINCELSESYLTLSYPAQQGATEVSVYAVNAPQQEISSFSIKGKLISGAIDDKLYFHSQPNRNQLAIITALDIRTGAIDLLPSPLSQREAYFCPLKITGSFEQLILRKNLEFYTFDSSAQTWKKLECIEDYLPPYNQQQFIIEDTADKAFYRATNQGIYLNSRAKNPLYEIQGAHPSRLIGSFFYHIDQALVQTNTSLKRGLIWDTAMKQVHKEFSLPHATQTVYVTDSHVVISDGNDSLLVANLPSFPEAE